jgi:hypothetical protein
MNRYCGLDMHKDSINSPPEQKDAPTDNSHRSPRYHAETIHVI